MRPAIEMKELQVVLPGFALKNIDLKIPRGAVTGLIGRNGAGKTTLLKTLTDVYAPAGGEVLYDGKPLGENGAQIKAGLGVVYDSLYYPPEVRADHIAKMMAPFYPGFDMEKWHELMGRFELDEKKAPGRYSKGMQMKFMLAMALARDPELLILDEPTAGMVTLLAMGAVCTIVGSALKGTLRLYGLDYLFGQMHGGIFSILVICGVWFLLCIGAFHRSRGIRALWYVSVCVVCAILMLVISYAAGREGIRGSFFLGDIPDIFPHPGEGA